jgi:hypothetical protein
VEKEQDLQVHREAVNTRLEWELKGVAELVSTLVKLSW